jgi:hypothetical protein
MRKSLRIFLCCLSVALSACSSSLAEADIPAGPHPPIRYGMIEEQAVLEPATIVIPESPSSVAFEKPLLDYQDKMAAIPNAIFYDCADVGYDDVRRLMYYTYRIAEPMGEGRYTLHTFVGCVNIINGARAEAASFTDVIQEEVVPVGGEDYAPDEVSRETEQEPEEEISPTPYIIITPGSEDISFSAEELPDSIVKLTDTGDVFVMHETVFSVYRYAPPSGFALIYQDDLGKVPWAGDAPDNQFYINAGWSIVLEDVLPLYITPQAKFDEVGRDITAVTDILFLYRYTPPVVSGNNPNADPAAPNFGDNTGTNYDDGGTDDDETFGDSRPFNVPIQYRRDVQSEVSVDVDVHAFAESTFTQSRSVTVGTRKMDLSPALGAGAGAALGAYPNGTIPEITLIPIGDPVNHGFVLISTPLFLVLYDGHSGMIRHLSAELCNDEIYGYIRDTGGNAAQYTDQLNASPGFKRMYFQAQSATPYIGDVAKATKSFILRGNSATKLLAIYNMSRTEMSKVYADICNLHYRYFTMEEIYATGTIDRHIQSRLTSELRYIRNRQHDGLLEGYRNTMVPLTQNATWDYDAMLLSQRKAPAYADLNFLRGGYTVFPNALFAATGDVEMEETIDWSASEVPAPEEEWEETGDGSVTMDIPMDDEVLNALDIPEEGAEEYDLEAELEALAGDEPEKDEPEFDQNAALEPDYDLIDTEEAFGLSGDGPGASQTGGGVFNFVYPAAPAWRIVNGDLSVFSIPAAGELNAISVENLKLKTEGFTVALHATLETGLDIYAMTSRSNPPVNVSFYDNNGGTTDNIGVAGQFFLFGSRFEGSYFRVYNTTLDSADCILLGFREANRNAMFSDLRDARILGVKLEGSGAAEQNWVVSS